MNLGSGEPFDDLHRFTTVGQCQRSLESLRLHERKAWEKAGNAFPANDRVRLSLARSQCIENRKSEILPVEYFHVVFTVPDEIASIAYQNKETLYSILFRATAETFLHHCRRSQTPGRRDRLLRRTSQLGTERAFSSPSALCRPRWRGLPRWYPVDLLPPGFFLPVRVLTRLFRRLFLDYLQAAFDSGKLQFFSSLEALQDPQTFSRHLDPVRKAEWVVYAKPPFAGPQQVVDYVGR